MSHFVPSFKVKLWWHWVAIFIPSYLGKIFTQLLNLLTCMSTQVFIPPTVFTHLLHSLSLVYRWMSVSWIFGQGFHWPIGNGASFVIKKRLPNSILCRDKETSVRWLSWVIMHWLSPFRDQGSTLVFDHCQCLYHLYTVMSSSFFSPLLVWSSFRLSCGVTSQQYCAKAHATCRRVRRWGSLRGCCLPWQTLMTCWQVGTAQP